MTSYLFVLFVSHALGMSASHVLVQVDMYISSIYCAQARSRTNHCCAIGRNMYKKFSNVLVTIFAQVCGICMAPKVRISSVLELQTKYYRLSIIIIMAYGLSKFEVYASISYWWRG